MTEARALAVNEAKKALLCLFIQVPEDIARDVQTRVAAAFVAYEAELAQAQRETWEEAAKLVESHTRKPLMVALTNRAKGYNDAVVELATRCRAQAQGVKDEK